MPSSHGRAVLGRCADVVSAGSASITFGDDQTPRSHDPHPPILSTLDDTDVSLLLENDATPVGFDWLRASLAMHRGAVVVAERTSGTDPLVAGTHFLSSSAEHLPTVLDRCIADSDLRQGIVDRATAWLEEHPLAESVAVLLDVARAARRSPAAEIDSSLLVAVDQGPDQPAVRSENIDANLVRRILREVRLDLFDVKREQRRAALLADGVERAAIDEVEQLWVSPALDDGPPAVSVITASFQHCEQLRSAIGSVARSDFDDLEMVIVDDGSTDATADAVIAEASRHEGLALRLLRHRVNRGLGPARNTALDHARADLFFVLDADNLVRPEGLGRLVSALDDDPSASAAYGMLDRFDASGPDGLLGALGWWPQRFRSGNYIDAMAMFRTAAIRALGGYATDRRLYGWEDYDLWCGLAESGAHAVRVPNFVGRYRVSGTSMVSISDYSNFAAFAALSERHPALMGDIRPQD